MSESDYLFVREVDDFDLDTYIAHLGWTGPHINTVKIYSRAESTCFYLHDELTDKLYEFVIANGGKLNGNEDYKKVVGLYFKAYSIIR